jgi:2-dehydro-3-deoxyglucarate aldolase
MDLKTRLRKRKTVFGSWTSTGNEDVVESFLQSKFDYLGIDLEHSTISLEKAKQIILLCEKYKTACLPRVPNIDEGLIKRLLDAGASGIIVPNIESENDVKRLVQIVKYPPVGKRGYGISRAQAYGKKFTKYTKTWNRKSIIVIQIESFKAVNNFQKIISNNKEIDAVMIGPYDLSGSLGVPGKLNDKRVLRASQYVLDVCKKNKLSIGIHDINPTKKSVLKLIKLGYNFITLSSDIFLLLDWTNKISEVLTSLRKRK